MSLPTPSQPRSAPASPPTRDNNGLSREAQAWNGAWAIGVVLLISLILIGLGGATGSALFALCVGGLPGAVGWLARPESGRRTGLLLMWALSATAAVLASGGITGPLAVWCAAPLIAAVVTGGAWRLGMVLAFAVLIASALLQAAGVVGPEPRGPLAWALAAGALAMTIAGAGAAALLMARGRERRDLGPHVATERIAELEARLRQAEAAKQEAEASAQARVRFLANISHELRTPLNAIMGFSDIMRARLFGELSAKYGEYAELIHESGRHLLDLINDVLDMSKIEAEKYELSRERLDVRDAVNAALRIMRLQADEAGVQLRGVLPADELEVEADRRAIRQIVLNLVSNALKFTPRGGSVTVSVRAAGGLLEITVADTGVGIAPEDLARIGRPFEQAGEAEDRARGTGLGLSLVKAFSSLHGGEMSIESRLGEGTAVTVRLPVLVDEGAQPERPAELSAP